ncbi:uncharacterized protein LOC128550518 [Mercenaria mercenaria]|uniref:uncharacterized protein LOC128550518 n=1 Tax=Mercenaria mercenaria TaxID=6596 RepID=UPI00234F6DB7|nr:uncharacterized protein LOC128550518 [Mercenaria mercenaria]
MLAIIIASAALGLVAGQANEVAFSAGLTHNEALPNAKIVVYDRIYTNIGGAYDSTSGNFTCPTAGYYVFEFHTLSEQGESSWLELYHNDKYIQSIYGHTSNDYASGGNAVVLLLAVGDKVYIKSVDGSYGANTVLYGQTDEVYSTFSGYLVHATEVKQSVFISLAEHGTCNLEVAVGQVPCPSVPRVNGRFYENSLLRKVKTFYNKKRPSKEWSGVHHIHDNASTHNNMLVILFASAALGLVAGQANEVAFSVGLTYIQALPNAANVVYDRIYTNIGAAYNSTSGTFTCPTAGYYVFEFHTLSEQDKSSWLELYHNNKYIQSIYGHTSNDYASGGNAVVLLLAVGDKVYIKSVDGSYGYDTVLYGAADEIYSTFSGYLVHAT